MAFSSSFSISHVIISVDLSANVGTILDCSGGLSATPWFTPAVFVGGTTAEVLRAGLLLAHLSYLVSSSVAFAISSALSLHPHPLRLLSESTRLFPNCSLPQNLRSAMLSLLILVDFLQAFRVGLPEDFDWNFLSLGGV